MKMIEYQTYNVRKTAHMAMEFLHLAGGTLDRLSLLKFMYLADRTSFRSYGFPISYDTYFSLKCGPILSQAYDNIKGLTRKDDDVWGALIATGEGNDVHLVRYEELHSLSDAELKVIKDTFREHKRHIGRAFINHIHEICPEWEDPNDSRKPIHVETMLHKIGFQESTVLRIEQNMRERARLETL